MFEPPPAEPRCRVLYVSPLKALAVDIERNLRAPLAGIANRAASRGDAFRMPTVSVRTGDTPSAERARFQREPSDILITTPESLYLLLTANAREALRSIDTVIIDEIHALVPTKRGAHLCCRSNGSRSWRHRGWIFRLKAEARSSRFRVGFRVGASAASGFEAEEGSSAHRALRHAAAARRGCPVSRRRGAAERRRDRASLEARRRQSPDDVRPPRRQSSARRRSRFTTSSPRSPITAEYRPVTIVDTSAKKRLDLRIEVPVEDMARLGQLEEIPSGPASSAGPRSSIWTRDPSEAARAGAVAPLDADFRQQPAHRRTPGRRAQRARGRSARPIASRLAGAAAADRGRGSAEGRAAARPRRDLVARARHRHGRDRSRRPDRSAAVGGERPAAHRPCRPHHRRRRAAGSSSRSTAAISSPAPRSRARCASRRSRRAGIRATRSTCWRSRSSRWSRWTTGTSTRCTPRSAAPRRSRSCAAASSTACSTCSRDAIPPTSSPIFVRA